MKKVLFVGNTLGQAGAEMAMMAMMSAMHRDGWTIDMIPMLPLGEMYDLFPDYVNVIGGRGDSACIHSAAGRRKMACYVGKAMARKGWGRLSYLQKSWSAQKKQGSVKFPLLAWRILADYARRSTEPYDLAIGYLEGAATYYVADYVSAKVKVAFVHIDLRKGGYVPALDIESYRKLDHVFAVSNAVKDAFIACFPELTQKVSLFHNMLDPERIHRMKTEDHGFQDDFQGLRLLSVGRLMTQKKYDVALQACAVMKKRNMPVRWYVIGDGNLLDSLTRLRSELDLQNDFIFLGAMKNPYPYVSQCDVFMQTTGWEGRSIALFEAQTLCRPIIVSDCPGNTEQIHHGINGLVTKLEPEAIADAVEDLLKHPEKREAFTKYLEETDPGSQNDLPQLYQLLP